MKVKNVPKNLQRFLNDHNETKTEELERRNIDYTIEPDTQILHHARPGPGGDSIDLQVTAPRNHREAVMRIFHDMPLSYHGGFREMIDHLNFQLDVTSDINPRQLNKRYPETISRSPK